MSKKNIKLLIVEDQGVDITLPHFLATNLGLNTTLAFDGHHALDLCRQSRFDLIVLDMNMPVLSGREFLKTIEYRSGSTPNRPWTVVLHTGETIDLESVTTPTNAYQIIDVWSKPMPPVEMLKRFKEIIERKL